MSMFKIVENDRIKHISIIGKLCTIRRIGTPFAVDDVQQETMDTREWLLGFGIDYETVEEIAVLTY